MNLQKITIGNFKCLYNASFEPGKVNVFIGANGSGKSTILEAIGLLSAAMTDRVDSTSLQRRGVRQNVPKLYKSYFRSIPRQKPTVDLALEWKDEECPDPFRYNVYLTTPTDSDYWRYQAEALFQNDEKSGDAATLLSSRPTALLAFS